MLALGHDEDGPLVRGGDVRFEDRVGAGTGDREGREVAPAGVESLDPAVHHVEDEKPALRPHREARRPQTVLVLAGRVSLEPELSRAGPGGSANEDLFRRGGARSDRRSGQVDGGEIRRSGHGGLDPSGHGRGGRVRDAERRPLVGPDLHDAQVEELSHRHRDLVDPLVRHQARPADDERVASRGKVEEEPPPGVAPDLHFSPDDGDRRPRNAGQAALVAEDAGDRPLPPGRGGRRRR
jgi:hypothetical protein